MNKTQIFFAFAIIINALYLMVAFVFFFFLDSPLMNSDNNDYLAYHNAGLTIIENLPDLYKFSEDNLFPFRYFPIAAYFFTPFSLLGLKIGYFLFQLFNFVLNIVILYLIFKIVQVYTNLNYEINLNYNLNEFGDVFYEMENDSILYHYGIFLIMGPQLMNYFLGQINILVTFFILVSLFYFMRGELKYDFLGGLMLGLGILFKPTIILILLFIIPLNFNRESKKLTFQVKETFIKLLGSILLLLFSAFYFLIHPQMVKDFIKVNLSGEFTYIIEGDLEINPSFSLTRILLILLELFNSNINNFIVFIIITLIFLIPIYLLYISSGTMREKLILGYFAGILIVLIAYFDSWPHHLVLLAPFLIFFILLHKDFKRYIFYKYVYYLVAILIVIIWIIFYLTYEIFPFNIGGLILMILIYYNLLIFYMNGHK